MSLLSSNITRQWLSQMHANSATNSQDDPNYYTKDPESLLTTSDIKSFSLGTGEEILQTVFDSIVLAQDEVLLVTCFWAQSRSLEALSRALKELSKRALQRNSTVQVRICFSSRSLLQKLCQTSSPLGEIYPPSCWQSTLGLPPPQELRGLDLRVKSIFFRPFAVIHPKFVVLDRTRAVMPSCNISWEEWFEGGIELEGDIVKSLLQFYHEFWASHGDFKTSSPSDIHSPSPIHTSSAEPPSPATESTGQIYPQGQSTTSTPFLPLSQPDTSLPSQTALNLTQIPTILLPSPHHVNPLFRPFSPDCSPPPPTPLNLLLLTAFTNAKHSIYIQTPNATSPPALQGLLDALQNGVDVRLVTSARMMVLEQLLTAGTVTELAIWDLQRRYDLLCRRWQASSSSEEAERGKPRPGLLSVSYYHPRKEGTRAVHEPVKSHLKLIIVDDELVVLGSGNMDRASWYTSQELGVAFFSKSMASTLRGSVDAALESRLDS